MKLEVQLGEYYFETAERIEGGKSTIGRRVYILHQAALKLEVQLGEYYFETTERIEKISDRQACIDFTPSCFEALKLEVQLGEYYFVMRIERRK